MSTAVMDEGTRARPTAGDETGGTFRRVPALDGLRGVAVLAVIAFHADIGWARGGFLGVDVFFVLSGYLITSLLWNEFGRSGSFSLIGFWARRARRLLPALGFLFIVLLVFAALRPTHPGLTSLRGDMLASLGYIANWRFMLVGDGYFAAFAPSPLRHLWSLAIEEQFYLLWPLVFLVVVRLRRPALAVAGVAAASAVLMYALYEPGDPSRAYFGTGTHVHGLLFGAALALVPVPLRRLRLLPVLGTLAAAAALVCMYGFDGSRGYVYRGGLVVFELLIVVVVAACAQGGQPSPLRSALEWRPLRAIGLVSYGLYLWHWPVFVLCDEQLVGLSRWPLLVVQLVVTTALALFSYFVIEMPVRRGLLSGRSGLAFVPMAVGAIVAALLLVSAGLDSPIAAADRAADRELTVKPGQLRVLLVGDSTAHSLAPGLQASEARFDMVVQDGSRAGCALDSEADSVLHSSWDSIDIRCNWGRVWPGLVAPYQPDVVLVMFGPLDIGDHRVGDRIYTYGSARWRSRMYRLADEAVDILGRDGADVVFLLSPQTPISQSARPLNMVLRKVARDRGLVFFNLGLTAGVKAAGGRWDGVHYSKAGGGATGRSVLQWIDSQRVRPAASRGS